MDGITHRVEKTLYVIKAKTTITQEGELTPELAIIGWETSSREGVLINEGHERGRLHSLAAKHLITWAVGAGDEIVFSIPVTFTVTASTVENSTGEIHLAYGYYSKASVNLYKRNVLTDKTYRCDLLTTLGRQVMLGEDGAEDAFGHDALREALEYALEDDWRPAPVEFSVVEVPDTDEGDDLMADGWLTVERSQMPHASQMDW